MRIGAGINCVGPEIVQNSKYFLTLFEIEL